MIVKADFSYPLLEDPGCLARCRGWSRRVYQDLLALQEGKLSEVVFRDRHVWTRAILVIDMTDLTTAAISAGDLSSLLRILDAQKVAIPALQAHGAEMVHCFADDIFATFAGPDAALDAALEAQRRIASYNASALASDHPTELCMGIGFGEVLRIGPDEAQGAEMNKASKLGEDIARARDILITEQAHRALKKRRDVRFKRHGRDEHQFVFFEVDYR